MFLDDIFMSCVWLILLCFHVFTPISYEPYYVISCCTHLTFGCRMLDLVDISMPNLLLILLSHAYRIQVI